MNTRHQNNSDAIAALAAERANDRIEAQVKEAARTPEQLHAERMDALRAKHRAANPEPRAERLLRLNEAATTVQKVAGYTAEEMEAREQAREASKRQRQAWEAEQVVEGKYRAWKACGASTRTLAMIEENGYTLAGAVPPAKLDAVLAELSSRWGTTIGIIGPNGTGKSTLAALLAHWWIDQCLGTVKVIEAAALFDDYTDRVWSRGTDATAWYAEWSAIDLLIFDEFDARYGQGTNDTAVSHAGRVDYVTRRVLMDRDSKMRRTAIVGNLTPAAMDEAVGVKIADRMNEAGAVVVLDGPSKRGSGKVGV